MGIPGPIQGRVLQPRDISCHSHFFEDEQSDLSRPRTRVLEFSTNFMFSATEKLDPVPNNWQQFGFQSRYS